MEGFYVSIIFLGIILVIFSLLWTAFDKKKTYDHGLEMDEKKDELVEIINDADQMIDELNKFSDYIVSTFTVKQEEVSEALKNVEAKLIELETRTKIAVGLDYEPYKKNARSLTRVNTQKVNIPVSDNTDNNDMVEELTPAKSKPIEKVIPLNSRYREVIKLADQGLCDTEIAKILGMGKGEIRLVLDTSMKV